MAITFYRSFLLRLWRERRAEGEIWVGEIELIQSGERVVVSSPREATAIILRETAGTDDAPLPAGEAPITDRPQVAE